MISEILPDIHLCGRDVANNEYFLKVYHPQTIINLGHEPDTQKCSACYIHIPLQDDEQGNTMEQLAQICAKIIHGPGEVFVHCDAGISRSPAAMAFYLLMYHQKRFPSLDHAFDYVAEKHPIAQRGGVFFFIKKNVEVLK